MIVALPQYGVANIVPSWLLVVQVEDRDSARPGIRCDREYGDWSLGHVGATGPARLRIFTRPGPHVERLWTPIFFVGAC